MKISIQRMAAWIEKQPEKRFFFITYGDTDVWCSCQNCEKLDIVPGQFADRNLYWVNGIARAIGKKYPDKVFLTLAYRGTQKPPLRLKPEPNVIVLYAPWWGSSTMCRIHPYYSCNRSLPAALEMEGWLKWAPKNLGVYDYSIGPQLKMHAYEKKLKFWAKRGYRAFYELGNPKRFRALENFVKAKLVWDASLDPAKLEAEFCDAYYGPAGTYIADLIRLLYLEKGGDRGTHDDGHPEYVRNALRLLESAEQSVKGTDFEARFKADRDLQKMFSSYKKTISNTKEGKPKAKIETKALKPEGLWLSKSKISRKQLIDDFKMTPLRAIYAIGDIHADFKAAKKLQLYLQQIYGVRLPVNPDRIVVTENTREVILVGKKISLASKLITQADFAAAGKKGVVVRGLDGRIAIAASNEGKTATALEAFLHIIKVRHGGPFKHNQLPVVKTGIIREFTLIDWPPFGP
jgi:hypothetical protein